MYIYIYVYNLCYGAHIIFFIVTELEKTLGTGTFCIRGNIRCYYYCYTTQIKFFPMWSFVTVVSIPIVYMTVRDTVVKSLKYVRGAGAQQPLYIHAQTYDDKKSPESCMIMKYCNCVTSTSLALQQRHSTDGCQQGNSPANRLYRIGQTYLNSQYV